jgi:lipoprotein-anchoring transpeptidase ErfK/SrfK
MRTIRHSFIGLKWLFALGGLALLAAPAPYAYERLFGEEAPSLVEATLAPEPVMLKAPPPVVVERQAFAIRSILDVEAPLDLGDYAWNDEGVAGGPLEIVVDLNRERLYVYRGGVEIGRSSILYGADDKPTPTGTFPILEKDEDHVSNLYDADMPYMLRLTWDGIAIHGSEVRYGYATNGCVGVPDEFAALLFAQATLGDKVLVTNDWKRNLYRET